MFAEDTFDIFRKSISEGMLATPPREVRFGAMKGMTEDEPLFELVKGLKIPKMIVNATARDIDDTAIRDDGVNLRIVATKSYVVMNENPEEFNQLLSEAVENDLQVLNP